MFLDCERRNFVIQVLISFRNIYGDWKIIQCILFIMLCLFFGILLGLVRLLYESQGSVDTLTRSNYKWLARHCLSHQVFFWVPQKIASVFCSHGDFDA